MSSVLGTAGALNGATDFCVEGFVRRDPLDDGGSGNTMFFDFGLKLMARQATNTRAVTLEGTPVGSTLTYNPGTDRTVPTDRFIHFAITSKSSDRKSTRLKSSH